MKFAYWIDKLHGMLLDRVLLISSEQFQLLQMTFQHRRLAIMPDPMYLP